MKLYYSPGACSLAPHIALREAGATFDLVKVDLATKRTESGADYLAVAPLGKVPALDIGEGEALTENAAILQYAADQAPASGLAPAANSPARYRLQSWLSFLSAELHKAFVPLFVPGSSDEVKAQAVDTIHGHLKRLDGLLATRDHLVDGGYTVADIYLFVILGWPRYVGMDISAYPALGAYAARIGPRPAVQAALQAEGLI